MSMSSSHEDKEFTLLERKNSRAFSISLSDPPSRERALSIDEGYEEYANRALSIDHLLQKNSKWADKIKTKFPEFFSNLAKQQSPNYLWIGCSDSRVEANAIVGLKPGELFVHRNIANVVAHTDFNCLAVMQYAVDCLKVKHIIVCGHYGCGGVLAALNNSRVGLADNWLHHVHDVKIKHKKCLQRFHDITEKGNHLCELNVIEQAFNVCRSTIVQDAWNRGQPLTIHAVIYGMADGLLRPLNICASSMDDAILQYDTAVQFQNVEVYATTPVSESEQQEKHAESTPNA